MNWKKSIIITLDIIIGVYLVLAVTAFNKPDASSNVCNEVSIRIDNANQNGFLTESEVRAMLVKNRILPLGQEMEQISTRQITEKLRANPLVEEAECYKTQAGHVCINVRQRIPVIRIMTDNGDDYYVDDHGNIMQPTGYTCDVIVATGSFGRNYASKRLAPMADNILKDSFWRNQVVQLNVLSDGTVEMVPRVGDHIVYLGQPVGITRKLDRMRKFYLYGLSQAGWNKYSRISVEFDNQIICKKSKKSSNSL